MGKKRSSVSMVGHWPRLTRFYGISPQALQRLPAWLVRLYVDDMSVIRDEEYARAIEVASFPHMEDKFQRAILARVGIEAPVETIDHKTESGRAVLAGLGVGLVEEAE